MISFIKPKLYNKIAFIELSVDQGLQTMPYFPKKNPGKLNIKKRLEKKS